MPPLVMTPVSVVLCWSGVAGCVVLALQFVYEGVQGPGDRAAGGGGVKCGFVLEGDPGA
jgi:hypothetical protein